MYLPMTYTADESHFLFWEIKPRVVRRSLLSVVSLREERVKWKIAGNEHENEENFAPLILLIVYDGNLAGTGALWAKQFLRSSLVKFHSAFQNWEFCFFRMAVNSSFS